MDYIREALKVCGCTLLHSSRPDEAPFRLTFEAPDGERVGILAYAFLANSRATRNRPSDEHRFQLKYGSKDGASHDLWQDPFQLYTTLLVGIDPELGFFVGADPVLHSPTRFFISIEFKERDAQAAVSEGWTFWERAKRNAAGIDEPVEIMVGGTAESFLRYVRFERAAKGLDAGHRALLADKLAELSTGRKEPTGEHSERAPPQLVHRLSRELALDENEILDLIQSAPRLKMAVRGWVAEVHLERLLSVLPGISECTRLEDEGSPDLRVRLGSSRPLLIECKNSLRARMADGTVRVDFQRTRSSKNDPCSRFYRPDDFDVVAACVHPCTEEWDFRFALARELDPHKRCDGRLSNLVRLDGRWSADALEIFARALAA